MFTKTSVFTYYNITVKQSANKGVNYNKFLYTVNSNLQDSIYSITYVAIVLLPWYFHGNSNVLPR